MQMIYDLMRYAYTLASLVAFVWCAMGGLRMLRKEAGFYDPLRALFAYLIASRISWQIKGYIWPHDGGLPAETGYGIGSVFFALLGLHLIFLTVRSYEKTDGTGRS